MMQLVARLSAVFGPPKGDLEAFTSEIRRSAMGYTPEELNAAADDLIDNADRKVWPLPKEIAKACRKARAARIARMQGDKPEERDPFSREVRAEADRLVLSADFAMKAVEQGWIVSLHDFCAKHGRLPDIWEQAELMRNARDLERILDRLKDELENLPMPNLKRDGLQPAFQSSGPLLKSQIRMLEGALARRETLAARLFGRQSCDERR